VRRETGLNSVLLKNIGKRKTQEGSRKWGGVHISTSVVSAKERTHGKCDNGPDKREEERSRKKRRPGDRLKKKNATDCTRGNGFFRLVSSLTRSAGPGGEKEKQGSGKRKKKK